MSLYSTANFLVTHPLTRKNPYAAIGRFAKWQISSRLRDEVIVDWIAGMRLAVRRGMTGATGNIYAGLHEFYDMAFALHFLRSGDLFADIGANIGSYTILASGVCRAKTIAFEPDPVTAASLARNITLNSLEALVETHVAALGARAGFARFVVGCDTENRVASADDPRTREVPMETLDQALAGRVPVLAKLDVEGYEEEVLKGASIVLRDAGLRAVLTENRSDAVTGMLTGSGFSEYSYDAFRRRVAPANEIPMANALFLRDAAFAQQRVSTAEPILILGQRV